jgi:hypothetical protein
MNIPSNPTQITIFHGVNPHKRSVSSLSLRSQLLPFALQVALQGSRDVVVSPDLTMISPDLKVVQIWIFFC